MEDRGRCLSPSASLRVEGRTSSVKSCTREMIAFSWSVPYSRKFAGHFHSLLSMLLIQHEELYKVLVPFRLIAIMVTNNL